MKVALFAAAASLVIAFAAHAADAPAPSAIATVDPATACDAGLMHKTAYTNMIEPLSDPSLCPQFLSTLIMKMPHRDQRT